MVIERQLVTVDEFEKLLDLPEYSDRRLELIHGEIVEKPVSAQSCGRIAANVAGEIGMYLKQNPIGFVEIKVMYRPAEDNKNVRMPDVAFFADIDTPSVAKGAVPRMPDLAVEVKSPGNTLLDLRAKIAFYLANGTRLGLLMNPANRMVEVYPKDEDVRMLMESATLDLSSVLPDLKIPVAELFRGA